MTAYFDYPDALASPSAEHATFLHGCDRRSWTMLRRHSHIERVAAGNPVVRRGDAERSLLVLLDGALVVAERRRRRTRYQPGDVFGELTFFDGLPQSVDVIAVEDSHVLRIRHDNFEIIAAHDPALARHLLMDLGRAMAARLRAASARRG
jgi:CRP-like cAMP-binding protein